MFYELCRLILMLLKETNHWHLIWRAWVKVRYGLTERVLEDTGLLLLLVIAMSATTQDHLDLQSANRVVASQPSDGE